MIDTNQLQQHINYLLEKEVKDAVRNALYNIDLASIIKNSVENHLNVSISKFDFPEKSIPSKSIKFENKLSGDVISGGVIENFSSTGMEDFATQCVLSLDDDEIKIQVPISVPQTHTQSLIVDGDAVFKGRFNIDSVTIQGLIQDIKLSIKSELYDHVIHSIDRVVNREEFAITVDQVKFDSNVKLIENSHELNPKITHSNIQKLGYLQELQVKGESLFANTLLVTNKKVGINNPSPDCTLEVWDQECQITWQKRKNNQSYLGTNRSEQEIVFGSNGHENITIMPNGATKISKLVLGNSEWISSDKEPTFESTKGHIVVNSDPSNGIFAWVCAGGSRWASVRCG